MRKKMYLFAIIVGVAVAVKAETEVLFYTDFRTTPEGFAAASESATTR